MQAVCMGRNIFRGPWKDDYKTPANYGDLMVLLGDYFSHGELGVIFEEKGYPDWLVKVVNQDAEDDTNLTNMEQTDFFQTVFDSGKFKGVPILKYFWRGRVDNMVIKHLHHLIHRGRWHGDAISVLDLDERDEVGVWVMERLASTGTDHSQPLSATLKGVAEAAADIYEEYGTIVTDLHDGNYGQRENGEFVIFDPAFLSTRQYPQIYAKFPSLSKGERMAWFIRFHVWVRTEEGKPMAGHMTRISDLPEAALL